MLKITLCLIVCGLAIVSSYQTDNNYSRRYNKTATTALFCYINGSRLLTHPHNFYVQSINVHLCTHVVYGGAYLEHGSWDIKSHDQNPAARQSANSQIPFDDIINLKQQAPGLKVLISISGEADTFSAMVKSHRGEFLQKIRSFLSRYQFDGVNIDWQYPGRSEGSYEDKQNFGTLIKELKTNFRANARLLTISISSNSKTVEDGYQIKDSDNVVMDTVDYWIIMAMEYYNYSFRTIGANAPIQSRQLHNVEKTITDLKLIFEEKNAYKLILAVPFYGRRFQLREPLQSSNESPFHKAHTNLHVSSDKAILAYYETCQNLNNNDWRKGWDSQSETPYIVKNTQAITYEDPQSVAAKTNLALRYNLGGVMAFSIDMDDYNGDCSRHMDNVGRSTYESNNRDRILRKYPLLQAMHDAVERGPNSAALHSSPLALVVAIVAVMLLKLYG